MKKFISIILTCLMFTFTLSAFTQEEAAANSKIFLTDLEPYNSNYYYENDWNNEPFLDVYGNRINNGVGFTSHGIAHASYNVEQMGYKTFTANITLESKWVVGDFGKTAVGIYADDELLYEKQVAKTSGIIPVTISLPKKTKNFHIIVKQVKGAKGTHGLILQDAAFSTAGTYKHSNELAISPQTIGTVKTSSYYYENQWDYNDVFQDIAGNLVSGGFGHSTYSGSGGTTYSTYNIDEMGFNVFETKVSLDSKWTVGDFGRSAIGIYADDYLLYEKEFTAKTPVQSIKVNLPKGTKELRVVTKQLKGARGTQGVVFIQPLLKKTKDKLVTIPKTAASATVGAIETSSYYYENDWNPTPFQYSNGTFATSGVGLTSYGSGGGTSYAIYDVSNMGFNSLKTKLSLDSKYLNGDYGSSKVYIYADNTLLYNTTLKKTDLKSLTLKFPANTKRVKIVSVQKNGAKGTQNIVFGNAVFTNLPVTAKPLTKDITIANNKKKDDKITIRSLAKSDVVRVYNSQKQLIASGTASGTSITLTVKQLGTKKGTLYITKQTPSKLESDKTAMAFRAE